MTGKTQGEIARDWYLIQKSYDRAELDLWREKHPGIASVIRDEAIAKVNAKHNWKKMTGES